jgi:hypothetical protein
MSNVMIMKVSLDVDLMGFHGYYRCLKWDPQRTTGCISGIFDGIIVGISWDDGIEPTIRDSIFTNNLAQWICQDGTMGVFTTQWDYLRYQKLTGL